MQPPDLKAVEDTLVALACESIATFAVAHPAERFYAFGFDCNAEYGDVLLCFNSEAEFARTAARYVEDWHYDAAQLAGLKRNFGDWAWQGFNCQQERWEAAWAPYRTAIETYVFAPDSSDEEREAFLAALLDCFCRALIRVDRAGAFDVVRKEPGFYTQVVDHDEDVEDGDARLARVRAQQPPI